MPVRKGYAKDAIRRPAVATTCEKTTESTERVRQDNAGHEQGKIRQCVAFCRGNEFVDKENHKRGFYWEYVNGYLPSKSTNAKPYFWLFALLGVLVVLSALFFIF